MDCALSHYQVLAHSSPVPWNLLSTSDHMWISMLPSRINSIVSSSMKTFQISYSYLDTSFSWLPLQMMPTFLPVTVTWYHSINFHILPLCDINFLRAGIWSFLLCIPITCHSTWAVVDWMSESVNEWSFGSTLSTQAFVERSSSKRCHAKGECTGSGGLLLPCKSRRLIYDSAWKHSTFVWACLFLSWALQ